MFLYQDTFPTSDNLKLSIYFFVLAISQISVTNHTRQWFLNIRCIHTNFTINTIYQHFNRSIVFLSTKQRQNPTATDFLSQKYYTLQELRMLHYLKI